MLGFPARFVDFFDRHGFLRMSTTGRCARDQGWLARVRADGAVPQPHPQSTAGRGHPARRRRRAVAHRATATSNASTTVLRLPQRPLRILEDPTPAEREVLGAFPTRRTSAVLHTDDCGCCRGCRCARGLDYHLLPDSERPGGAGPTT